MSGDDQAVIATVRNRVGHLTLNRPQGLNALTLPMIRALSFHLQAWAQDSEVLAVVLRGSGEKPSVQAAISARCTRAMRQATTCISASSMRNTNSTSTFMPIASRSWH